MTDPMAPDDILRACGYLEAVWRDAETDTAALLRHEPGETPTAILLTELGENIMQQLLPAQAGIHNGMPDHELAAAAEKMRTDPTVQVSRGRCHVVGGIGVWRCVRAWSRRLLAVGQAVAGRPAAPVIWSQIVKRTVISRRWSGAVRW
ncbi:hypothetical protein GCM10010207_79970 [Streptomyces atratus]|nr:hypothetical protein GCM10010207_79970 [Streptomyces atratus]